MPAFPYQNSGDGHPYPNPCSALRTHPGLGLGVGGQSWPCCDNPVPPRSLTTAWLCRRSPRSPMSPQCCPGSFFIGSFGKKRTPSTPCVTSSSFRTQRMKVVGSGSGWGWATTCVSLPPAQGPTTLFRCCEWAWGLVDRPFCGTWTEAEAPLGSSLCSGVKSQWACEVFHVWCRWQCRGNDRMVSAYGGPHTC